MIVHTPPHILRPRGSSSPASAFTLVELLAVIAVVGLLIGILIPVVGEARSSAKSALCTDNLRQLGVATRLYLADNKNVMYPHTAWNGKVWYDWLRPYVPKVDGGRASLYCPLITDTYPSSLSRTGYGKNGNLGATTASTCKLINGAYEEGKVVVMWDDTQVKNSDGGWPTSSTSYGGGSWYELAFRHDGACHILLLDGHVAALRAGIYKNAKDFPQYQWGPFNNYPDRPIPPLP